MNAVALVSSFSGLVVRSGDIFDALRRSGGEAVRQSELSGDGSGYEFAFGTVEFVDADGREEDWGGDAVPEYRGWMVDTRL